MSRNPQSPITLPCPADCTTAHDREFVCKVLHIKWRQFYRRTAGWRKNTNGLIPCPELRKHIYD